MQGRGYFFNQIHIWEYYIWESEIQQCSCFKFHSDLASASWSPTRASPRGRNQRVIEDGVFLWLHTMRKGWSKYLLQISQDCNCPITNAEEWCLYSTDMTSLIAFVFLDLFSVWNTHLLHLLFNRHQTSLC